MACVGNQYGGFEQTLFLGCSVVSFTASAGWNEQVTEVTIELVEDPCAGPKVYWDGNLEKQTLNDVDPGFLGLSNPIIGVPAYFRLKDFEFCGLIQSWEKTQNNGGTRYMVKLVSPVKILEETKIIIGEYAGSVTPSNSYIVPASLSPYNIINVFGYAEAQGITCPLIYQTDPGVYNTIIGTYGAIDGAAFGTAAGAFGGSLVNNNGMPWYMIKNVLDILVNSTPKISEDITAKQFSPYGRILHKGVNYSSGYGLLGKDIDELVAYDSLTAVYPLTEYFIDLSEIPAVPNYYRFNQSEITILEAITKVCQDAGYDFFIELLPVRINGISDHSNIAKFIKVRTISRISAPSIGQVETFINNAQASGILVSSSYGREFRNDTTSKFVIGGKKQTVYQAYQSSDPDGGVDPTPVEADDMILPFFGTDSSGNMIIPYLDDDGYWEFQVPTDSIESSLTYATFSGLPATINERELMAAADQSIWSTYITQWNTDTNKALNSMSSFVNVTIPASGLYHNQLSYKVLNFRNFNITIPGSTTGWLDRVARDFDALSSWTTTLTEPIFNGLKEDTDKIYQWITNFVNDYYGKKFAVRVPYACVLLDTESNQLKFSEQPTQDGGWTEMPDVLGLPLNSPELTFFRNESNKIQTIVAYTGFDELDTSELNPENYVVYNNNLYLKGNVDSEYVTHMIGDTRVARAIVDIPSVITSGTYQEEGAIVHGVLKLYNILPTGIFDRQAILQAYNNIGNKTIASDINDRPFTPDAVAFGIQSNINTYGPWISMGPPGGVAVEKNDGLVPWEYGGYTNLNTAGMALANAGVTNMQVSEVGSATIVGYPTIPIFAELNSLGDLAGKNLVENREAVSGTYYGKTHYYFNYGVSYNGSTGPPITNITISNQKEITTQYSFRTYTPRFGRFAHLNAERLKEVNQNRMQYIRDLRTYITQNAAIRNARSLSLKQGISSEGAKLKRKQRWHDRILRAGTPHEVFVGQLIDFGTEKRTIINTCSLSELPTELGSGTYIKKSITSLDSLIRPISIKGVGNLPRLIQPTSDNTGLGTISQIDLNPYANPITLEPSGLLYRRYNAQDTGTLGHDIDIIARSNYISGIEASGFDRSIPESGLIMWRQDATYDYSEDYRGFALRGPILLQSWGYDTNGYPVPNVVDNESGTSTGLFESTGLSGYFMSGWLRRPNTWPVAPIDLRLDRQRGVWVAGSTSVDTVLITGNIYPSSWDISGYRLNRESFQCLRLAPSDSGSMVYSDTISVYNPFATTVTVSANKARIATVMGDTLMNVDCAEIDFTGIG